jgi:hypothetical protein|tara:strand:+ start:57 stop:209 length:153 start_codon:yes stop_codon:yes gene_type:complete
LHDSNQHNSDGIHVLNDKKPDINGKDNLKSLNIVFASYKSNKLNKEIRLK